MDLLIKNAGVTEGTRGEFGDQEGNLVIAVIGH